MLDQSPENLNKATQILFEYLFNHSKLDDSGRYVEGYVLSSDLYIIFFKLFIKDVDGINWPTLMTNGNIEECETIETFYSNLVKGLISQGLISLRYSSLNSDIKLSLKGYKYYLALLKYNKKVDIFNIIPSEEEHIELKRQEIISIPETLLPNFKRDILQITKDYDSLYRNQITKRELEIRFLANIYPNLKNYYSLNEAKESGLFDGNSIVSIQEYFNKMLLECFRENLIVYDHTWGLINLTKHGYGFLTGGEEEKPNTEEKKAFHVTTIIHISDLHFGSLENTGIDNKEGLKDVSAFKNSNFELFASKCKEIIDKDTYLIISGDLTSKNETIGYKECSKALSTLNIPSERIYIIPGNHDFDRNETEEDMQFSAFISIFRRYPNVFANPNYIIDDELKLFIIGFNSTHFSNNEELFYIDKSEIDGISMLITSIRKKNKDFDTYSKLAVVHASLVPHPNIEIKKYGENIFNLFRFKQQLISLGFKIIFSGHKHSSLIQREQIYIDKFAGDILLVSAGSLSGQVTNGMNSFQVLKLKRDLETGKLFEVNVSVFEIDALGNFNKENENVIEY